MLQCICFPLKLGKTVAEAKKMIDEAHDDGLVGITCCELFVKLKKGEFDLKDKPCTDRVLEFGTDFLQALFR